MILLALLACLDEAAPLVDPELVAGTWVSERTLLEIEPTGSATMTWMPVCAPWCSHELIERDVAVTDYEIWHTSRMLWLGPKEKKAAWPATPEDIQEFRERMDALARERQEAAQPMVAWWLWLHGDLQGARAAAAKAGERGLAEAKALGVDLQAIEGDPPGARGILGVAQQTMVPGTTVFEASGRRLVLVSDGPAYWIRDVDSPFPAAPDLAPAGEKTELPPVRYASWTREGDVVQLQNGPAVDVSELKQVEKPDPAAVVEVWKDRWLDELGPPPT